MYPPSTLGEYNCDSPWALVQSAIDTMKYIEGDDLEFIIWTGYVHNFIIFIILLHLTK
ncbi:hypothetical protein O3M35_008443 [Rhynocoris fuscipes]|uniref:Uncharacterized protein n=1 Tax=Rhynocoris fuscipes TaxID=488301 RepID=A0AAW1D6Y8_9HEMI